MFYVILFYFDKTYSKVSPNQLLKRSFFLIFKFSKIFFLGLFYRIFFSKYSQFSKIAKNFVKRSRFIMKFISYKDFEFYFIERFFKIILIFYKFVSKYYFLKFVYEIYLKFLLLENVLNLLLDFFFLNVTSFTNFLKFYFF